MVQYSIVIPDSGTNSLRTARDPGTKIKGNMDSRLRGNDEV